MISKSDTALSPAIFMPGNEYLGLYHPVVMIVSGTRTTDTGTRPISDTRFVRPLFSSAWLARLARSPVRFTQSSRTNELISYEFHTYL